jgi:hypothetical protein
MNNGLPTSVKNSTSIMRGLLSIVFKFIVPESKALEVKALVSKTYHNLEKTLKKWELRQALLLR